MSLPSALSNPAESDDDPDILQRSVDAETAFRQQRARVRFISNASALPAPPIVTQDEVRTDPPHPQPILRRKSSDRVWRMSPAISCRSSFDFPAHNGGDKDDRHLLREDQGISLQNLRREDAFGENRSGQTSCTSDNEQPTQHTASNAHGTTGAYNSGRSKDEGERKRTKSNPEEIYNASYRGFHDLPPPDKYRGGVLSQLLKLYKQPDVPNPGNPAHQKAPSDSGPGTGMSTPERRKWYEQNLSPDSLATLIGASANLANPAQPQSKNARPKAQHKRSFLSELLHQEELHVKVHIADTLARQDFILKLCRALMLYGAPTHRLEEYLTMTARALEIEAQFLYLPGCMIISFDDSETHTTSVKLVRLGQGIDLGRLKDVHRVYKEVLHDTIGVEGATGQLDELMTKKAKFHAWLLVLVFGLTSVTAAPFSFDARLIDLPLCFFFGCLVGTLQLVIAPMSPLYSNVLEVTATVIVSFLARAFGSIRGGDLFCFSALAQGGIVMLLPGYMFLSSSLELQARAIVPGSIRIVYGIIYSLLLGFGITVGSALYGFLDSHATSDLKCTEPITSYYTFIFVPFFVLCISMLYQAKWAQMPMMIIVGSAGYVVNYFSSLRFASSPQIASGFGSFTVGCLANLYSRFRHGVAAAILVPAIFTQVPGGLASTGGLLSGLEVANKINNSTHVINGTSPTMEPNYIVFNVASSMIQIAIGITVGLFMSALVIYPLGKRGSGLFSL